MAKMRCYMSEFRIQVSDELLDTQQMNSESIFTSFCFCVKEQSFPSSDWTDFAYPALCIWAENVLRLPREGRNKTALYFMDGPFLLDVAQHADLLTISGKRLEPEATTEISVQCSREGFLRELLRALGCLNSILKNMPQLDGITKQKIAGAIEHYEEKIKQVLQ